MKIKISWLAWHDEKNEELVLKLFYSFGTLQEVRDLFRRKHFLPQITLTPSRNYAGAN